MKVFRISTILFLLLLLPLLGCQSLLPSTKVSVKSPWQNFDNAKDTYEKITPGTQQPSMI